MVETTSQNNTIISSLYFIQNGNKPIYGLKGLGSCLPLLSLHSKIIGIVISLCDIIWFLVMCICSTQGCLERAGNTVFCFSFPMQVQLLSYSMNHLKLLALNCRLTIVAYIKKHAHLEQ